MSEAFAADITAAYQISNKSERQDRVAQIRDAAVAQFANAEATPPVAAADVAGLFGSLEKKIVRGRIIAGAPRIDGRDNHTVRPLDIQVGVLGKTHGSALFTRGETQALVVATLGAIRDAQVIEDLSGTKKDSFMLHYNFPPFSVGETGMMSGPKRREVG